MRKIHLVGQGGGVITCYHAGVIRGLINRFGRDFKKLISKIVVSSGAANVYSYLASGQEDLIEPIWIDLLNSGKFVTPLKHPTLRGVMNVDFLIDEMVKTRYPLNTQSLRTSQIELLIGLTDADKGKSLFVSSFDKSWDYFELLRASTAVPYFSRPPVKLNGSYYYDGTIGDVSGLEQVMDEDNILIVLTRPYKPLMKMILLRKFLRWLWIRHETQALQDAIWSMPQRYDKIPQQIANLRREKNICVIQPKQRLPIGRIDTSVKRLNRTIEQGYQDVIANQELDLFMSCL